MQLLRQSVVSQFFEKTGIDQKKPTSDYQDNATITGKWNSMGREGRANKRNGRNPIQALRESSVSGFVEQDRAMIWTNPRPCCA
jgi:hypothetical protein